MTEQENNENPFKGAYGSFEHFYENGQLQAKGQIENGERFLWK